MIHAVADYASFNQGWRAGAIVVGSISLAVGAAGQHLASRWWHTWQTRRDLNRELDRILPKPARRTPPRPSVMPRRGPFDQDRP